MTNWRKTIRIKQFLSGDDSDENARKVAAQIAATLRRQPEYDAGGVDDFSTLVEEMADIETDEYDSEYTPCRHLNACLDALYDWADAECVWIGGER